MTIISSSHFDVIYIPVLILCTGLFIFSGLRQKYPVSKVAGISVFLMVLFVIGLKIIDYPVTQWGILFSQSPAEIHHTKYVPGGIIFVALGLLLLKFVLKIRLSLLDSLIPGLPLIGILQRVDCLLSGCCYGTPTQLPWAIHYSSMAPAYKHHVLAGLISETATSSLGIHPTQLYYIIGFLLVFVLLLIFRKKVKSPGSLALLGFILMAVSRFIIEFFREPVQNRFSSLQWAGVNLLQWVILILVVILAFALYQRENRFKYLVPETSGESEYLWRNSFILFITAVLVWNFSGILAYSEFIFLQVLIALSVLVVIIRLFQKSTIPSLRYPTMATLCLTIIFMSQKSSDTLISGDSTFFSKKWLDINVSTGGGKYDQINYDCGGNQTSRTPQQYSIVSGGVEFNYLKSRNRHLQAGMNLGKFYDSGNTLSAMNYTPSAANSMFMNFINPYFKFDFRKVGFGLGYNVLLSELNSSFPSLYFRAFPLDKFFFDANLADNFHASGLAGFWQIGMGTGFGNAEKHVLRFGLSTVQNKAIAYVGGNFLVYDRFRFQTSLGFGNKIHGMVGVHYLIGKNKWISGNTMTK